MKWMKQWWEAVFGSRKKRTRKRVEEIIALVVCLYDDAYNEKKREEETAWARLAENSIAYHSQTKVAMRA